MSERTKIMGVNPSGDTVDVELDANGNQLVSNAGLTELAAAINASNQVDVNQATRGAGEDQTNDILKTSQSARYVKMTGSGACYEAPCKWYGWICDSSSSLTLTVNDHASAASDNRLLNAFSILVTDKPEVWATGIEMTAGMYVTLGGTGVIYLLIRPTEV